MKELVEFLEKVPAFAGVSREGLLRLARICRPVEAQEGEVIIKEGEEGDCVFIVERGQVEISMSITLVPGLLEEEPGAMDKVLVRLGPGGVIGEMAFIFDRDKRSATVTARSDCRLLSINSEDFKKFTEEDIKSAHRIVLNIARLIAERLRKTNQDMKKLTTVLTIVLRKPRPR